MPTETQVKNNQITMEDLKEIMNAINDSQSDDGEGLSIRDLAKIAKALKSGNVEDFNTVTSTGAIGTTWELTLEKYPDFVITRKTTKTEQMLVIMPSCGGYYIKAKNGKGETIIELTETSYQKFSSGMPTITLSEDMWIGEIESGVKFFRRLDAALKNQTYMEMVKYNIAVKFEHLHYYYDNSRINDDSIPMYEASPQLYKEFNDNEKVKDCILRDPSLTKVMIEKFGLNNMRNFCNTLEMSLIQSGGRWNNYVIYSSASVIKCLLSEFEFHYKEFMEYVYYTSVRMGYALVIDTFFTEWLDSLRMQMDIYGKIKEKYPKDLPVYHLQLSYIKSIKVRQINEEKFNQVSNNLSKYNMIVDDYIFVCPQKPLNMQSEAQQQCNCLASYIERYAEGESEIFFMRKTSDPAHSYITIEKRKDDTTNLRQIYYANNRPVNGKDYEVAAKWLENCGKIDDGRNPKVKHITEKQYELMDMVAVKSIKSQEVQETQEVNDSDDDKSESVA